MLSDLLYEFVVVVRCGTMTKAARELGFAQSALSQHIARLERELGVKLLERGAGGVQLTDDGRYAYDVASDMSGIGEALVRHFSNDRARVAERSLTIAGLTGSRVVSWAFSQATDHLLFSGIVAKVGFDAPSASIHAIDALRDHSIDVLVTFRSAADAMCPSDQANKGAMGAEDHIDGGADDIVVTTIFRDPVLAVVEKSHPLAGRRSVSLAELYGYEFARYIGAAYNNDVIWTEFVRVCGKRAFSPIGRALPYRGKPGYDEVIPNLVDITSFASSTPDDRDEERFSVMRISDITFEVVMLHRAQDALVGRLAQELTRVMEGPLPSDIAEMVG